LEPSNLGAPLCASCIVLRSCFRNACLFVLVFRPRRLAVSEGYRPRSGAAHV
jgi:hypothetical protein